MLGNLRISHFTDVLQAPIYKFNHSISFYDIRHELAWVPGVEVQVAVVGVDSSFGGLCHRSFLCCFLSHFTLSHAGFEF